MTVMQSHDDWLLSAAERHTDPPATCDGCGTVVEHASELAEFRADYFICDTCDKDRDAWGGCANCDAEWPTWLLAWGPSGDGFCVDCTSDHTGKTHRQQDREARRSVA